MRPALILLIPLLASVPAAAQTSVVPRTTITVDERPMVVQPGPFSPATPVPVTPSPEQRRRRTTLEMQQTPVPGSDATPPRPRQRTTQRQTSGYTSFLTGPIDLRHPPGDGQPPR